MNQDLLFKYIAGEASQQEKEEVAQWIDAEPKNLKEFIAMRRLYEGMIWQKGSAKMVQKQKPSRSIGRELLKIAAVAIAVFAFSYSLLYKNEDTAKMQTVYVPAGQRAQVTLADGTVVWMNSQTKLTFPDQFSDETRNVTLNGEAYFDVKGNQEHPFIVRTQKYDIRVLGTQFNVRSYNGQPYFETALFKGKVEVKSLNGSEQIILSPGQQVYTNVENRLQTDSIHFYDYYLWKDGLICFDDAEFKTIIEQLERYYDMKVNVKKTSILNQRYSGKFRAQNGIEHILKSLQLHTPFKYTKDESANIITIQ